MKSNTAIQLNKAWWKKEQPAEIKNGAGDVFLKAIGEFEPAKEALDRAVQAKKDDMSTEVANVKKALKKLDVAGTAIAKEVTLKLKDTSLDSKVKKDLENTLAVVGKPLAREIAALVGSLSAKKGAADATDVKEPSAEEDDEEDADVKGEEDFKKYLAKILPRLRKGAYSFAVVLPSSDPKDIRMAFHRSKGPKALASGLKKSVGGGKFTWGIAAAEKAMDDVDETAAATLILALDSKILPGLAKKIKKMFGHMEVQTFKKVKLLVDGQVVETDDTEDLDLSDSDAGDTTGALPEGGSTSEELNSLYVSYQELKRKIVPLIGPAKDRYPDQAEKFTTLVRALVAAEQQGKFDVGIATLRDRVVPLLKSSQHMASATDKNSEDVGKVQPTPSPHAQRDALLNKGLQKVLERTFPPEGQTWFDALKSGSNKKVTSGEDFFKSVKVKYPKDQKPKNHEQLRAWAINMSVLQHMTTKVAPDSSEAKVLMKRQMGYLLKFANIPNTEELKWQANPTQVEADTRYHRTGGTKLQTQVKGLVATELGVSGHSTFLVSDRRVMEEVGRHFTLEKDLETVDGWSDDDYDAVLRHALAGESSYIDCSKVFKSALDAGETPQSKVVELTVKLKERAFANAVSGRGKEGMTPRELAALGTPGDRSAMTDEEVVADKKRVLEELAVKGAIERDHKQALEKLANVRMGGIMSVGEMLALTTYPFKASVTASSDAPPSLDNSDQEAMKGLVGHSGFTVGPEQLLDHWVSQTPNTVEILRELGVTELPSVEFPSGKRLDQFSDFDADFLGSKAVDNFKGLADDDTEPPYVKVMVAGMMSMVNGLQNGARGFNVQSCLDVAGLNDLWSISLNKIQGLMAKATKCKGSMRDFLDQIALIQEEVATLIAVAKPYSEKDFKKGMLKTTDMFPDDFLGNDITAEFSLKNSASRCFNSVLTACEDSKEFLEGDAGRLAKRGLSVLVQGDSYYEPSMYVLDHANDHSQTTLNTDGLQRGGTEKDFDDQLDKILRAQTKDNKAKLDTYLCEFHHNISYNRKQYSPEDVAKQVRKLIDKDVVANPFTVAIDTTIAKTDEANVKTFLNAFKTEIKDGKMNVVIYRSAQKFDQMGADLYNGGIMCCITANAGDEPTPLQRALDSAGELPSEDNMQGLTHLNLSGQEEINAYRTAIMENTKKIGDPNSGSPAAIPATMLRTPANDGKSLVQVAINDDDEAPFLDIKLPFCDGDADPKRAAFAKRAYEDLQKVFLARAAADPENAVTSTRASFGFQHTNVTLIDGAKLRVNPGLEDDARLKSNTDTLVAVNDMLMQVSKDLAASDDFTAEQLDELIYHSEMVSLPVVEAHTELKEILKNDRANAKKQDAARLKMAEAWCQRGNRCANPPGVLKLLDELSPKFQRNNAARIDACRTKVTQTTTKMKMKPQDQQLLADAEAAKAIGHVQQVKDALNAINRDEPGFAPQVSQYDALDVWASANGAKWSQQLESHLQAAVQARDADDPVAANAALDQLTDDFKDLRKADCESLTQWIVGKNKKDAEGLLGIVQTRLEAGLADTVEPFLAELERMQKNNYPGMPNDFDAQFTNIKRAVEAQEVARQIDQALSDAAEFQATNNIVAAKKRCDWAQKIIASATGIVTAEQTDKCQNLRAALLADFRIVIDKVLANAAKYETGDETDKLAKHLDVARKLISNIKEFVSETQTAEFGRLENVLKSLEDI